MKDRNLSIDALRAIAALSVLLYHSSIPPFPIEKFGVLFFDQIIRFFGSHGRVGVDLFFILSGFCIHWAHVKRNAPMIVSGYLLRRWWRIYPPYFFALSFAVILNLGTNWFKLGQSFGDFSWHNFGFFQIVSHVFLLHNFFSESAYTISGPFWTIAVEAQFYIFYLALTPMLLNVKGWLVIACVSILLSTVAYVLLESLEGFQPWHSFLYWPQWLAGAALAQVIKFRPNILRFWPVFLILFMLLAFIYGQWSSTSLFSAHLRFYVLTLSITFLILVFIKFESIWNYGVLRWVPALGIFSYSLYLIHFPVMDRVRTYFIPTLELGWPRVFAAIFGILLSVGLSYIFFISFENPFLKKASQIVVYQSKNKDNFSDVKQ